MHVFPGSLQHVCVSHGCLRGPVGGFYVQSLYSQYNLGMKRCKNSAVGLHPQNQCLRPLLWGSLFLQKQRPSWISARGPLQASSRLLGESQNARGPLKSSCLNVFTIIQVVRLQVCLIIKGCDRRVYFCHAETLEDYHRRDYRIVVPYHRRDTAPPIPLRPRYLSVQGIAFSPF
jgi:hypothetical protein